MVKRKQKRKRKPAKKRKKGKSGKSGKSKMPASVLAYFRYRNEGLSKAAARKKAGMGKK
jgi:hypothetical protein